ncbi:MAG: hypothetical protein IKQ47_07935 [Prevotella sp.]|nr:hypothetical protein [Prevotella sp.]
MKKFTIASVMALVVLCSCDDGSVIDKTYIDEDETYSVVVTGRVTGMDTWASGYNVVLGGFNEESDYSLIQKSIAVNDGEMNVSLTGIPKSAKTIEIAAVTPLRIKIASVFSYDIPDGQRTDDVIRIDLGTLDASMFATIQKNIFENTSMNCSRCHRSATGAGKLTLVDGESYAALVNVPSNHNGEQMRVVPGDADGSLLYQAMTSNILPSKDHTGYFTDKANIRLLNMLKAWIDGGAKN